MSKGTMFTKRFQMTGKSYERNCNKPVMMLVGASGGVECYYPVTGIFAPIDSDEVFLTNTDDTLFSEEEYWSSCTSPITMTYSDVGTAVRINKMIKGHSDVKVQIYTVNSKDAAVKHEYHIDDIVYTDNAILIIVGLES